MHISLGTYHKPNRSDMGKTWLDIVREIFPKASDDECDYLLWEQTGFPLFWNISTEGKTPADCARVQLNKYRMKLKIKG